MKNLTIVLLIVILSIGCSRSKRMKQPDRETAKQEEVQTEKKSSFTGMDAFGVFVGVMVLSFTYQELAK